VSSVIAVRSERTGAAVAVRSVRACTAIAVRSTRTGAAIAVRGASKHVFAVKNLSPLRVIAAGLRGAKGADGAGGSTVSPDAGNQIEQRQNGLYAPPADWETKQW
jgi:hypothetical protein